jgi:hypothetical protein
MSSDLSQLQHPGHTGMGRDISTETTLRQWISAREPALYMECFYPNIKSPTPIYAYGYAWIYKNPEGVRNFKDGRSG